MSVEDVLGRGELSVQWVGMHDPLVVPMLAELQWEYQTRYGDFYGDVSVEISRYPAEEFAPPHGALLVLVNSDHAVAGGAFRRYDEHTAELKRVWTHSQHRRSGLGRRVLAELEAEAVRRGYGRIYLTTGPRQPEAAGMYLATGYRPLFDVAAPPTAGPLPFEKDLVPPLTS